MGLIEIAVAGLCFNLTCPEDEARTTFITQEKLLRLAEELRTEHLRVTTFDNGELSGYTSKDKDILGTGVAFAILDILQVKYHFNYSIVLPEENAFLSTTSTRTGAKDLLETKKADLVAALLPIINSFRGNITYSTSLDNAEWVVLMTRPTESATGSGLLAPFTTPVWILIILSLLVVGPIIHLLVFIQARLCRDENNKVYALPECAWFVYGALLKQGTTLNPSTDSSRLLFSTWWIFITILTAFYTANLTAFLTLSKFTLPINSASDIKHKKYHWITNKANGIRDYTRMESREFEPRVSLKLVDKIGNASNFPNEDDMSILKNYVTRRGMMFIREKSVVNHVMYIDYKEKTKRGVEESQRCTYVMAKFPIITLPRAFAYSTDFKYKQLFDHAIQHLVEAGIIQFKLKENLPDTEICPLNLGNSERRLRNSDLLLTYYIVGGGLAVASSVFLLELLIKSWLSKLKMNRKPRKVPRTRSALNHNNNNKITWDYPKNDTPPPPSYHTLFKPPFTFHNPHYKKQNINGRDYWVFSTTHGAKELIPIRTPSALLFQYSH